MKEYSGFSKWNNINSWDLILLKERVKKMRKFIEDNNLSDEETFQSTDIPKDENGFIDFNKIEL